AGVGFDGNGSSSYLDTHHAPSLGSNTTDGSFFAHIKNNITTNSSGFGCRNFANEYVRALWRNTSNEFQAWVWSHSVGDAGSGGTRVFEVPNQTTSVGFNFVQR